VGCVGTGVGCELGEVVGYADGATVGLLGFAVGTVVGLALGAAVGATDWSYVIVANPLPLFTALVYEEREAADAYDEPPPPPPL
jgi:ABC-type nitrate/sulfonate/bicarbonate transport system permease component